MFCSTVGPLDNFGDKVALSMRTVDGSTDRREGIDRASDLSAIAGLSCMITSGFGSNPRGEVWGELMLSMSLPSDDIGELGGAKTYALALCVRTRLT